MDIAVRCGIVSQDTVRVNIQSELDKLSNPVELKSYSIYRVPQNVRDRIDKKYYEPRLISIGPYHRKKDHLRAMEERKHLYLQRFLDDSKPGALQEYIDSIRDMEPKARACYFESPVTMSPDDLVEMLLLDGCFILQFFIQWFCDQQPDPIWSVAWNLPLLHNDLLMLENQIPYFVLRSLYDIYCRDPERPPTARAKKPLMRMIAEYFSAKAMQCLPVTVSSRLTPAAGEEMIDHLLHLYYCHIIIPARRVTQEGAASPQPRQQRPRTVPCAKELTLHGVRFKRKEKGCNMLDVSFKDGIFEIPHVSIEEPSCSRYMNLVAFEMSRSTRHDLENQNHFTSYVVLMDYLINTPDDVLILNKGGIVESKLSNDQEVADFFNHLRGCSYIDYDRHYLAPVYVDVNDYCLRKWPSNMATLRRVYLSNPWAAVGFSFGLLFAGFTIYSTVISILQTYFHILK